VAGGGDQSPLNGYGALAGTRIIPDAGNGADWNDDGVLETSVNLDLNGNEVPGEVLISWSDWLHLAYCGRRIGLDPSDELSPFTCASNGRR